MPDISIDRLEFATSIFVRECIRQNLKLHPGMEPAENPVKALAEYPRRQQLALMVAFNAGMKAAGGMDELFQLFMEDKLAHANIPRT